MINDAGVPITALVVGSEDNRLYGFDAATGDPLWEPFVAGGKIWSTPVIQDNTVFFGSHDKNVYAVDLRTGEEKWRFATGGTVVAKPLIFDDKVIVGSFDRTLYALEAQTGTLAWAFKGSNWFWAGAVAGNSTIYAASMDGDVYALDRTGELQWEHRVEGAIASTPALVPERLVVAGVDGKISVLDIGVIDPGSSL